MRRRSRLILAIIFVALTVLAISLWPFIHQKRQISALHAAVKGKVKVEPHRRMEEFRDGVDSWLFRLPVKVYLKLMEWYDAHAAPALTLFNEPVNDITLNVHEFHGDVGKILTQFPELRWLGIYENDQSLALISESEWKVLCSRLRTCPSLGMVRLQGAHMTDAALAPLAGHPTISGLSLSCLRLTPACATTLASMPSLRSLYLKGAGRKFSPEERRAYETALPHLKITFLEDPKDQ